MTHLYLDTALSPLTMHVVAAEEAVFSFHATEHRASDSLHVELDKLLIDAGLTLKEIQNLTLVRGPGSFTGVRIAYTIAEALKLSQPNIKIQAVTTLETLAYSYIDLLPEHEPVQVVSNAHGGQMFTQTVQRAGDTIELMGDISCLPLAELSEGVCLAEPVLNLVNNLLTAQPQLTAEGFQQAQKSGDYSPLYVKSLTYRKLSDAR